MPDPAYPPLLHALLDSWDRGNRVLVNLLQVIPEAALPSRPAPDSPSIAQLFSHIHYVRLVFVLENAPEFAKPMPEKEWDITFDRHRMAEMLNESAATVREAVQGRTQAGRAMNLHFDHPILLLQHMLWHEGYHHGQIKLTLKLTGSLISDEVAGPLTWRLWMDKTKEAQNFKT